MEHPKDREREFRKEYEQAVLSGATIDSMAGWMNSNAKKGIRTKLAGRLEKLIEQEAVKPTYGEIIKTISKAKADIEKLKEQPEKLVAKQRKELNEKFDDLVDDELYDESNRDLWVAGEMNKFLVSDEYLNAKNDLKDATNLYSKSLALKEEWEQENADIIEAERARSRREELLSADPEALRALGITPPPVQTVSGAEEAEEAEEDSELTELTELKEALRSIHPSATEAELESMAKLYG